MARRKKQGSKRPKSTRPKQPVKPARKGAKGIPPKKLSTKLPTKAKTPRPAKAPAGSYFAYINARGQRVKAGTKSARRITVKVNVAALKKAATKAGRVGGKFATHRKAKRHASGVAANKKGKGKAALTRFIQSEGGELSKDFLTEHAGFHYRFYACPYVLPQPIDLYAAIIERERLEGAATLHVRLWGKDMDGNLLDRNTPAFRVKSANARTLADAIEKIAGAYEFSVIEGLEFRFRYARKGE